MSRDKEIIIFIWNNNRSRSNPKWFYQLLVTLDLQFTVKKWTRNTWIFHIKTLSLINRDKTFAKILKDFICFCSFASFFQVKKENRLSFNDLNLLGTYVCWVCISCPFYICLDRLWVLGSKGKKSLELSIFIKVFG